MMKSNKTEGNSQTSTTEIGIDVFDNIIDRAAVSGSPDDMSVVLSILGCIVHGSLMVTE